MRKLWLLLALLIVGVAARAERRAGIAIGYVAPSLLAESGSALTSPYGFELDAALFSEGFDPIAKAGFAEALGVLIGYDSVYFPMMAALEAAATNGFKVLSARAFLVPEMRFVSPAYRAQLHFEYAAAVGAMRPDYRGIESWLKAKVDGEMEDFAIPPEVTVEDRISFFDLESVAVKAAKPYDRRALCLMDFTRADGARVKVEALCDRREFGLYEAEDYQLFRLALADNGEFYALMPKAGAAAANIAREFSRERFEELVAVFDSVSNPKVRSVEAVLSIPRFDETCEFDLSQAFMAAKMPIKGFKTINNGYSPKRMLQRIRFRLAEPSANDAETVAEGDGYRLDRPFVFFVYHRPTEAVVVLGKYDGR